jgi:hypothetical protein
MKDLKTSKYDLDTPYSRYALSQISERLHGQKLDKFHKKYVELTLEARRCAKLGKFFFGVARASKSWYIAVYTGPLSTVERGMHLLKSSRENRKEKKNDWDRWTPTREKQLVVEKILKTREYCRTQCNLTRCLLGCPYDMEIDIWKSINQK